MIKRIINWTCRKNPEIVFVEQDGSDFYLNGSKIYTAPIKVKDDDIGMVDKARRLFLEHWKFELKEKRLVVVMT